MSPTLIPYSCRFAYSKRLSDILTNQIRKMTSNKTEINFMITRLREWNETFGGAEASTPCFI
jgi:hypothetical protein